jgi:hypothetical protein
MTRRILCFAAVVCFLTGFAAAQRGHGRDMTGEFFGQEAFLRPLKIVAGSYAPELTLARFPDEDCAEGTLNVSCFPITNPDIEQAQTLTNVSHIVVPANSLRDALILDARNFYSMWHRCDAPSPDNGLFVYNPTVTIKSPALPAPIVANLGHRRSSTLIFPDVCGTGEDQQYSRTYRLTRSLLRLSGYTDSQIDGFFGNDITIELNITMRVRNTDYADAYYDFMVYGY